MHIRLNKRGREMDLSKYMKEISLMKKQNMTEYDMYSVIGSLIREGKNVEFLSIRDVNRRRKSKRGQVFYGLSGTPDFAILNWEFDNNDNEDMKVDNIDKIYGCVEIKEADHNLLSVKDIIEKINPKDGIELGVEEGQILGEVLWYRKLLYTNGIRWMYYEWEKIDKNDWGCIKSLVETRISKEEEYRIKENIDARNSITLPNFNWYNEINFKNIKINEIELINLSEEIKDDQWNEFLYGLHNIKWNK